MSALLSLQTTEARYHPAMTTIRDSNTFRRMTRYWPVTFVVMVLSFLVFGALSLNLAQTFLANVQLISTHGTMALADGALLQLFELLTTACLNVACYIVFKTCESALVQRILSNTP